MTNQDALYVKKVFEKKQVKGSWIELGVGYGGETCKELCEEFNLRYSGTDMFKTDSVDYVIDFETPKDHFLQNHSLTNEFDGALVLNVLEHTFDPTLVLDNVIQLLKPGGICIVATPVVWPIHNYPIDCWRPLPDFYRKYCTTRSLKLEDNLFEYIGYGLIDGFKKDNCDAYPPPTKSSSKQLISRIVHKIFNTTGRGITSANHVAIGATITKSS